MKQARAGITMTCDMTMRNRNRNRNMNRKDDSKAHYKHEESNDEKRRRRIEISYVRSASGTLVLQSFLLLGWLTHCDSFTFTFTSAFTVPTSASVCRRYRYSYSGCKALHVMNVDSDSDIDGDSDHDEESTSTSSTYYSPNAPLDTSKYRYDLQTDDHDDHDHDHETSTATDKKSSSSDEELAFFDEATIFVRGGSGGQGSSTYKIGKRRSDGIPDGGNGGRGGDIILVADDTGTLNTLAGLTLGWRPNSFGGSGAGASYSKSDGSERIQSFKAGTGRDGGRQFDNGRNGEEVEIRVPPGTVVKHEVEIKDELGNVISTEMEEIGILTSDNPSLVVARGGRGGDGSGVTRKAAAKGKKRRRNPPEPGERKRLKLVLKLVADIALVGVPNAGKSTFLASVTRAKPKIANYPFTTVIPNLGVWVPPESSYASDTYANANANASKELTNGAGSTGLVICDVPGLVAGAAKGVGLGHAFLRHVERCHVILHLVDATSIDAAEDFAMLNRELEQYGTGQLADKPQVVVVNKIDAYGTHHNDTDNDNDNGNQNDSEKGLETRYKREELKEKLEEVMQHSRLMWVSAKEKEGVDELMGRMAKFLASVKQTKKDGI